MTNTETPTRERRPREETTRLGREMYERDIKAQVESGHHGEYVAIDVDSGTWAMSGDALSAANRLRVQRPEALGHLEEPQFDVDRRAEDGGCWSASGDADGDVGAIGRVGYLWDN